VVMSLAWLLSPVLLISCIAAVVKHSRRGQLPTGL
jgi:hypothetical protein